MLTRPRQLTPDEAKQVILNLLENGEVIPTAHCFKQSMPDADVDMFDVREVLKNGSISQPPVWEELYQNWKYRVQGLDLTGEELIAITVILEREAIVRVITVF